MTTNYTKAIKAYEDMRFKDVLKYGFHEFVNAKEDYILNCDKLGPRKDLI